MTTRVLERSPSLGGLYVKAVAPLLPLPSILGGRRRTSEGLPDLTLELPDVDFDPGHLARYGAVCGTRPGDTVPPAYPHVLAFPLHLELMTDAAFPFPVMGLVHIGNRIVQHRPLLADETVTLRVRARDLRGHPRGQVVTILSEVVAGAEVMWHSESTFLRPGRAASGSAEQPPHDLPDEAPTGPVQWRLGGDLGRHYASVSGDRNPIHLYDVTAKAFGFRRHIAHGMWTKARALAELGHRLPDSFTAEVAFKKPVLLPSSVDFGARGHGARWDFGVTSDDGSRTHLIGRITSA